MARFKAISRSFLTERKHHGMLKSQEVFSTDLKTLLWKWKVGTDGNDKDKFILALKNYFKLTKTLAYHHNWTIYIQL